MGRFGFVHFIVTPPAKNSNALKRNRIMAVTGAKKMIRMLCFWKIYNIYALKWIYNHDKGYPIITFRGMLTIFDPKTLSRMEN